MAPHSIPRQATPKVLALALGSWAAGAGLAAHSGTFEKLGTAELALLAGFVSAFSVAIYALDREVRAFLDALDATRLRTLALAADALLALGLAAVMAGAPAAAFPVVLAPLVALPAALGLHAAQVGRRLARRERRAGTGTGERVRSAVAKPPAGRTAAT